MLPTDRTPNAVLFTIPGTQAGSFGLFSFRGSADSMTMVDAMRMTYLVGAGPGSTSAPTNSNMFQEFSFSTNIDSAEAGQPGMRINLVPRDGGNQFHTSVFTKYGRGQWQSSNIDDALRAQEVTAAAKTLKQWDFNPSAGGPLRKERLWYYLTYQSIGTDTVQTGSFADADLSPRLGVAYDVFGNGKTALKVAVARFVDGETIALTGLVNPMNAIATTKRARGPTPTATSPFTTRTAPCSSTSLGPRGIRTSERR